MPPPPCAGTKRNNVAHPSIRIIIYDALNMASTVAAAAATARALKLSSCLLFILPGQISQPAIQPHYEIGTATGTTFWIDQFILFLPLAKRTTRLDLFGAKKTNSC
jgi:hypothetical protein